jgi:hypothetical protein
MPADALAVILGMAGALLVGMGWLALRASGARIGDGRRLAGAREWRVAELLRSDELPDNPVRIAGRVRCDDPIRSARDDLLVVLERDVDVSYPGVGWRPVERVRETRTFQLWDHAGGLSLDPAGAAVIGIPYVWRGDPDELGDPFLPAVGRLAAEHGMPTAARSVTRSVSVVDHLLVLASVSRGPDGGPALRPPPGGYLIATVTLDEAMRLLGGDRRLLVAGVVSVGLGVLALATALVVAIGSALV